MKQIFRKKETLENLKSSPHQHLRKCVENSRENTHTDVRVKSIKNCKYYIPSTHSCRLQLILQEQTTNHKLTLITSQNVGSQIDKLRY